MKSLLIFIIFLIIYMCCLQTVIFLISLLSYKKNKRYLHCRYLAAAVFFMFVFLNGYTFSSWIKAMDLVIQSDTVKQFSAQILPLRRYEIIYLIMQIFVGNLAITAAAFCLFFIIRLLFMRRNQYVEIDDLDMLGKMYHFPWVFVSFFYRTNEDDLTYQVSPRGVVISLWAKRMKYAFMIAEFAEISCLAAAAFCGNEFLNSHALSYGKNWCLLPMVGYILMEQVQFFLTGDDIQEEGSLSGASVKSCDQMEGNIEVLRELYKAEFEKTGALLGTFSDHNVHVVQEGLHDNGLSQGQLDDCDYPELLCMLDNQIREANIQQSAAYQSASIALLNGRSVNIRDQFLGEFLVYLAAYMNVFIAQGKTFLVLCNRARGADRIKEDLERELRRINKLCRVWNVETIRSAETDVGPDILICTYYNLTEYSIIKKRKTFFQSLHGVVMTDGREFCSENIVLKENVFQYLKNLEQKIQYVLISEEDNDTLRTAFEHYIDDELLPFKNDPFPENAQIMVWAEDSGYKIQRNLGIGRAYSPNLGVGIPLSLVAVKHGISKATIVPDKMSGFYTYRDAMIMSSHAVQNYVRSSVNLQQVIRYDTSHYEDQSGIELLILHDSHYNFYNTLWNWIKYGGKSAAMIHIVSPSYMLREYFASNMETLIFQDHDFDALFSCIPSLKRTRLLTLLMKMDGEGVSEEQLMDISRKYRWNYEQVTFLLRDCLKEVMNITQRNHIYDFFQFRSEKTFDFGQDSYRSQTVIQLIDDGVKKRMNDLLKRATVILGNLGEEELPILCEDIYNYCLPDQIISVNGYWNRVIDISDGKVSTEQVMPGERYEYLQASEFFFSSVNVIDECVDQEILDFNLCEAEVERRIYGYWSTNMAVDFQQNGVLKMYDIRDTENAPITVKKQNVPVLQIRMKKKCLGEQEKEVAILMSFMLRELFKTLFPETFCHIFAVMEYEPSNGFWDRVCSESSDMTLEEKMLSILPFKDGKSESRDDYLDFYIVEFSSLEIGMVSSLYANGVKLFQMMEAYLEWYLSGNGGTYLRLGGDVTAPCFAPEKLLEFCHKILPVHKDLKDSVSYQELVDAKYACSFCGKIALFTYHLDEGRYMCRSCREQQMSQKAEIRSLYQRVVDFLTQNYCVEFRKDIHLQLKPSKVIRSKVPSIRKKSIMGYYDAVSHTIWIESGMPRVAVQGVMIRELAVSWQNENIDISKLRLHHLLNANQYLEGHIDYVEIDAMKKMGESQYADYLERTYMEDREGYRRFREYMKTQVEEGSQGTPFELMKKLTEAQ